MPKLVPPTIDSAARRFFEELKNKRLMTTRCKRCSKAFYIPRVICPYCFSQDLEWVELSGRGKLYAFTQQERGLRFSKPDVIGVVELEEGVGKIVTRIDAPIEELEIGMEMEVAFIEVPGYMGEEESVVLHQFRPTKN